MTLEGAIRRLLIGATVALVAGALTVPAQAGPSQQAKSSTQAAGAASSSPAEYVVLYAKGASADAAHAAIKAAGGTEVRENRVVGLATVRTTNANFLEATSDQPALVSAMENRAIGQVPGGAGKNKPDSVENDTSVNATAQATAKAAAAAQRSGGSSVRNEPLGDKQWDMRQIDATPNGSSASTRAALVSGWASSTPASTAPTRTSSRTSQQGPQPQLHHRPAGDRRGV